MQPFAMDNARWRRHVDELREQYAAATHGSRNRQGQVRSPKGVVPVEPLLSETAMEYAAVWFMKLAKEPERAASKLCDYTHALEELANFAKPRRNGPRLHFHDVRLLLAVRSNRYAEVAFLV